MFKTLKRTSLTNITIYIYIHVQDQMIYTIESEILFLNQITNQNIQ